KTGPQSIHILRGVRQQQDEPGRFSICSRQAAVVLTISELLYMCIYVVMTKIGQVKNLQAMQ
ncbi:hypothetical protein ODR09_26040, partial [Escherichia coli]|nr:hypothetical protein [Escherichia coli]